MNLLTTPVGVKLHNRRVQVCSAVDPEGTHVVSVNFRRLAGGRQVETTGFDLTIEAAEALTTCLIHTLRVYHRKVKP